MKNPTTTMNKANIKLNLKQIQLTRYLYLVDNVLYTLKNVLLKQDDFKECVFWTIELYESGYKNELWDFVFEFYYNFCAIYYPKYEKRINDLYKINTAESICNVIYLLFNSRLSYKVHNIYTSNPSSINKIYLIDFIDWLDKLNIEKKYHKFIVSVHKNNYTNIMYYLKKGTYKTDYNGLYDSIIKYYNIVCNMSVIKNRSEKSKLDCIEYKNKAHIILALILYFKEPSQNIQKKRIFKKYEHEKYVDYITELDLKGGETAWKILPTKARYRSQIHSNITQKTHDIIVNEIRYNWKYHAYNCPLWKRRFDEYNVKLNHGNKTVEFENDDELDDFDIKYNYEFDEQSYDVQKNILG